MENEGRSEVVDMCLYVRFAVSTYFQHFWTEFESEKILPSDFRFFLMVEDCEIAILIRF